MWIWVYGAAAVFPAIAATVSFVRYSRTKNRAYLYQTCIFLFVAVIFGYLFVTRHLLG